MFLPLDDLPHAPGRAYVNTLLIAANITVFLVFTLPLLSTRPDMHDPALLDYLHRQGINSVHQVRDVVAHISAYELFVYRYGFKAAAPDLSSLFGSLFLHGGLFHLAGNMLFLWIFGRNVEHRLGSAGYLGVYLFTGVMATLFFAMFTQKSYTPLIGASGAISGVLGCYFIWFPRHKIKTFVFLFPLVMDSFYLPARLVLGFYLIVDNLLPFLLSQGGSGVAHGAHLGGFFAGATVAYVFDHLPGIHRGQQLRRAHVPCMSGAATIADQLQCLLDNHHFDDAVGLYFSLNGRQQRLQITSTQALYLGTLLLNKAEHNAALSVFRRFIADRPNDLALDQAFMGAGKALLNKGNGLPSAHQYFLAALDITLDESLASQARHYLKTIDPRI